MQRCDWRLVLGLIGAALGAAACAEKSGSAPPGPAVDKVDAAARTDTRPMTGAGPDVASPSAPTAEADAAPLPAPSDGAPIEAGPPDMTGPEDAGSSPGDSAPAADAAPAPLPPFPLAQVRSARRERLATVGGHIEGPTWREGELLFAQDGAGGGLMKIDATGRVSRYHPQLRPIGSFLLADGSVLLCDHQHLLVQMFRDGRVGVLASAGAPKCNDVTVDAAGNVFFSDYTSAIYRLTPGGELQRVLAGLDQPNGIEVDLESRYLYMATGNRVLRAELAATGMLARPQDVAGLPMKGDGMAFDQWGNLWVAVYGTGSLVVIDPARRMTIANLDLGPAGTTNLTFGGPKRDEIYVTVATSGVWRVSAGVTGFAGHPGAPMYTIKQMLNITPR